MFSISVLNLYHYLDPYKRGEDCKGIWPFKRCEDCEGYWRHWNCVFGLGNYKWIMKKNHSGLFANKFDCNTKTSADLVTKIENELMYRDEI